MATLDDKILGEKLHYYCSSSSEDDGDSEDESNKCDDPSPSKEILEQQPPFTGWEGSSTNTGPKGVIKDWQRYKQLETERREEQEKERVELMRKLSLTCQSHKDEELSKQREAEIEKEVQSLLDDRILEEFKQKRMEEMMSHASKQAKFGFMQNLNCGQDFLDAVDTEKSANVIIFIYREGDKLCKLMFQCFQELARDYPQVKFCSMEVSLAGMSKHFKQSGVPAVLVYNGGSLIGNFIRLTDELGEDFVTSDIENYLLEHGLLPDDNLVLSNIRSAAKNNNSDLE